MAMDRSVVSSSTRIRVSSTLDKSVSKKHLFDSSPETCWTSAQGLPQFIHLIFDDPVAPSSLSLTFQGGFVGIRCAIYTLSTHASQLQLLTHVFPEDVNRRQSFPLDVPSSGITQFKVVFEESSDFFGRITVYDMRLDTSLPEPVL
ncbi:hypothetical protein BOTBODRAFT_39105 [Botryobasidium botryosum FD-172 SS1]|uniref:Nuclear receptor 2C2-associated protein n=1 Tax=Botryobasidium botryosum (strain FD-172 SS1) TaxID=930990 RepID=A0A067LUN8_BOTB1|nr:hypothetical protein BOTBODRAFT_39105 [Botryobasidium botryosum FD-172 SS1]